MKKPLNSQFITFLGLLALVLLALFLLGGIPDTTEDRETGSVAETIGPSKTLRPEGEETRVQAIEKIQTKIAQNTLSPKAEKFYTTRVVFIAREATFFVAPPTPSNLEKNEIYHPDDDTGGQEEPDGIIIVPVPFRPSLYDIRTI